jgi:putative spermidine/putrescine transport system substrate-binding protein
MAAISAAVLIAACGSVADTPSDGSPTGAGRRFEGRTLTVVAPGGAYGDALQLAYFNAFQDDTGAQIKLAGVDIGAVPALIKSGVDAGRPPFDLAISLGAVNFRALENEELLEPVNLEQFSELEDIDPKYYTEFGLVADVDAIVAAYDAEGDAQALPSTSEFFDVAAYPGSRAVPGAGTGEGSGMCVLALTADGVAAEDLVPIDTPRCLQVWDSVRPEIDQYWTSGSQMAQIMVSGSADYCLCYDGRVQQAKKTVETIEYSLEKAPIVAGWAGVVKGTQNKDMAEVLLGYMLDPQREAVFTSGIGYATPNPKSIDYLPEQFKPTLTTSPENERKLIQLTDEQVQQLADQADELNRAWDDWINRG